MQRNRNLKIMLQKLSSTYWQTLHVVIMHGLNIEL